jgi:anaerobic selenocysteine-containing dehydrogenase
MEQDGHVPLNLPRNAAGETLPFSTPDWFRTPSGRAELLPVPVWNAAAESPASSSADPAFPLQFLPRKADNYMNTTFANLPGHQQMERRTAGVLEMNAVDAAARGVSTGDSVEVRNARGSITLSALVDGRVAPGVVAARLDWHKLSHHGANVNTLTSQRLTDLGGGATFYSTMVEVTRVATRDDQPANDAQHAESMGVLA